MQTPSPFESLRTGRLNWLPELGLGYYEVEAGDPYDEAYFGKYERMAATAMGVALTSARLALVRRWWSGGSIDVGIGCGQFVEAAGCMGFDINPAGVGWLNDRHRYADPYHGADAVTCWDSLEHIREPEALLACVRRWLFVSLPIFRDGEHAVESRHFRPDEHYWYFTQDGFVRFMESAGFALREVSDIETRLGREDILSFAFERDRQ